MIFPGNRKARPCRWNRAGCDLCPRTGMAPSFPFPVFPAFREREDQVEPRVKGHRSIEGHAFLPLEPLDKAGRAGREELLQVLVRQFLVQELAEDEQAAAPVVTFGRSALEDDMAGLAFGAGERTDVRRRQGEFQDLPGGLAGIVPDGRHERLRVERVPLYLRQGVLPASSQGDIRHQHVLHRPVEEKSLFRGHEAFPVPFDIVPLEQSGDDGCPCGGRSYSNILDGLTRLSAGDVLSAGLHGRQQRGFGVERLGHGLFLHQPVARYRDLVPFGENGMAVVQPVPVLLLVLLPAEDPAPAGTGDGGALRAESHLPDTAFHEQQFLLAAGRERFQHPSGDQGIDGGLRFGKPFGGDAGRDQGVVVGHFRVVHAAGVQGGEVDCLPVFPEFRHGGNLFQQSRDMRHDILRDVAASRPRVRYQFLLVQGLGDVQRLGRRQVEVHVAVLLELRQVVEQRRLLRYFFSFHFGDFRQGAGGNAPVCGFGLRLVAEVPGMEETAVRLPAVQRDVELPVRYGHEFPVLPEPGAYHGQRRGLHPPDGTVRGAGGYGQRTAGVHAHQPVRLGAAVGGGIQAVVFGTLLQFLQALPYGLVGERGDPQPPERFRTAQVVVYPAEDQLALTLITTLDNRDYPK